MIDVAAIARLGVAAGVTWFDYQEEALAAAAAQPGPQQRRCLYYKTGAGKSVTAAAMVRLWGYSTVLVIAPPSTHPEWEEWGAKVGVIVTTMSHAKFRMKDTKVSRTTPVIADEFHMFGGPGAAGFKKLDTLARHLQAPLVLASATPNYNDAERCYCIQHVLNPHSCKGGFLEFLYQHCNTRQNPFGMTPLVDEDKPFKHANDAADYLSSLPNVDYLEDDLVYTIDDWDFPVVSPKGFKDFGFNYRRNRIIASQIEERHAKVDLTLIAEDGHLRANVSRWLQRHYVPRKSVLVFAQHETVARAADKTLSSHGYKVALVTGKTPKKKKAERLDAFRAGVLDVLVGTASLATGTDGLDKVCDTLIILDDTDDDALRRQVIGRIMPRGTATNASSKSVHRLVIQ